MVERNGHQLENEVESLARRILKTAVRNVATRCKGCARVATLAYQLVLLLCSVSYVIPQLVVIIEDYGVPTGDPLRCPKGSVCLWHRDSCPRCLLCDVALSPALRTETLCSLRHPRWPFSDSDGGVQSGVLPVPPDINQAPHVGFCSPCGFRCRSTSSASTNPVATVSILCVRLAHRVDRIVDAAARLGGVTLRFLRYHNGKQRAVLGDKPRATVPHSNGQVHAQSAYRSESLDSTHGCGCCYYYFEASVLIIIVILTSHYLSYKRKLLRHLIRMHNSQPILL